MKTLKTISGFIALLQLAAYADGECISMDSNGSITRSQGGRGAGNAIRACMDNATLSSLNSPLVLNAQSKIAVGGNHTCAVKPDGTVVCWGQNLYYGQLGDGTDTNRHRPVAVFGLTGASSIAAGWGHTCAVKTDGTVACWGWNKNGQLGNGSTTTWASPLPVAVSGLTGVSSITAGSEHTCALKTDGTVACWGRNYYCKPDEGGLNGWLECQGSNKDGGGQLGDGTITNRYTPVAVSGLSGVSSITAGREHTCALKIDGTVVCWGMNIVGQLGGDTVINRHRRTPVVVSDLINVSAITAGSKHTCALKTDGTVACWGWNGDGQLGDGTTWRRHTLVAVSGLTNASSITAGSEYTCALKTDGTVVCWGQNGAGQLGGDTNWLRRLVTVPGLTDISSIAAGDLHTCARKRDGTVVCWGLDDYDLLGSGTNTKQRMMVEVPGLSGVSSIAAGSGHSCALKSDGTVACWGGNYSGQLGDGTKERRLAPVTVLSPMPSPTPAVPGTPYNGHWAPISNSSDYICIPEVYGREAICPPQRFKRDQP